MILVVLYVLSLIHLFHVHADLVLYSGLFSHFSCTNGFLQALNGKLLKAKDKGTKKDIRRELKALSKEERKRQQLAVTDVIKNADVVLTTLTGALSRKLEGTSFDLVIIDEAAQALEIACWIALLKVILERHKNRYG